MLLANGFKDNKVATNLIKDVYRIYLTLFSTILLRSKQISFEADPVATNDNEDKLEGLVSGSRH